MRFYFNGNNISNMNNLLKYLILSAILISIGVSYYFYRTRTYVTAEFRNLRPFHDRAPIYYNGFKIGKVVKVRPNKTYTATIVTLRLHPMDLKLPVNITANLKREKNKKTEIELRVNQVLNWIHIFQIRILIHWMILKKILHKQ